MAGIAKCVAPFAWEAFEDYILKSHKFSRLEMSVLCERLRRDGITQEYLEAKGFGKREAGEFLEKLDDLGVDQEKKG